MKNKILNFIIGMLVGAIIATVGFYFYSKTNINNKGGMPGGERPQMMQDGNSSGMPSGTPPEKPDGDNMQGAPGQKTNENSEQSNKQTTNTTSNT